MSKKKQEIIVSIILIVFSIAAFIMSMSYRGMANMDFDLGPAFLPAICCVGSFAFSVANFIVCLRNNDADYIRVEDRAEEIKENKNDKIRLLLTLALLLFYVGTFMSLGFLVSSIIYLTLQQIVFTTKESRKLWLHIVIGVGLPLICQVLFVNVMNYMLPMGILKGLF